MELGAPSICPSTVATVELAKTVRINILGTLEYNQKLKTRGRLNNNNKKICLVWYLSKFLSRNLS